jgi:hypothetical protein
VARGQVTPDFFPGTDLDALLEADLLRLDGKALDADGHVGTGKEAWPLRLVGVQTPKGDCCFLTNLPPRIGPRPVADLSRVRWAVELSIKLDKSVNRLDSIDSERPCSLKTRLPAALMASTIATLLAHTHHLKPRPTQAGQPRMEAPLHPRRLAWQLAVSCQSIAHTCNLKGVEAQGRWDQVAALLTHAGNDPHWRRRPSVFDQLRGWKRQPLACKEANSRNVSHDHLKAAA